MIPKQNFDANFSTAQLRTYFKSVHKIYVDPVLNYDSIKDASNKTVFEWQQESIDKLAHKDFGLAVAPCGSGKTTLIQALICEDVYLSKRNKKNRKQLIVVPENAHADNFVSNFTLNYKIKSKKRKAHWSIPKNFASEDAKDFQSRTKALKDWLLADYNRDSGDVVRESVAITTYSSFNIVWSSLTEKEKEKAARNFTILVDECHHIKNLHSEDVDPESLAEMTMMARAVKFIIENSTKLSTKVYMFTATNFRGDHCVVLGKEVYAKFTVYQLEFVRHFLTLGIDNLDIIHNFYDSDPIDLIGYNIENDLDPNAKHYVVVPPDCQKWNGNWRTLDRDIKRLKDRLARALMDSKKISRKEAEYRILDLVTKSTQAKNKKLLRNEPKFGEPIENSKFDIVITCKLGREGTDWCVCNRVHNASPERSEPLSVQTFGRSLRRFGSKDYVKQHYYMRRFSDPSPDMTRAELIADKVHHLLITMLMDETLRPILLPRLPSSSSSSKQKSKKDKNSSDYVSMREVFRENWEHVKEEIVDHFSLNPVNETAVEEILDYVLDKYEHEPVATLEDIRDGLKLFIVKCNSSKIRNDYVGIEFIRKNGQFNKLVEDGETFIYKLEQSDFKIFSVFKDDAEALINDEFTMLCQELPKVKAAELKKDLGSLSAKERRSSLREFYDFKNVVQLILEQGKKCTSTSIAKSLKMTPKIIEKRIEAYNKVFAKMGKELFSTKKRAG